VQLSEQFRIWIGYRSPQFLTFGYGFDMDFMKKFRIGSGLQTFRIRTPLVSMDRIRIGYPAAYLGFFRIRIGFGYLFLKKNGSGRDQDICLISITEFP